MSESELRDYRRRNKEEETTLAKNRLTLAQKLTMVMTDHLNAKLIRPGPNSEERECYEMSRELRDMAPEMAELFDQVLKQHKVVVTDIPAGDPAI